MEFYDRYPRVAILGIPIDNLFFDEVVAEILQRVKEDAASKNYYVSTLNTDFLTQSISWFPLSENSPCHTNPEMVKILRNSFLKTADGMPLVWLSYLLGSPLKQRVSGSDLLPALAEKLSLRHGSIYLLGGDPKISKVAGAVLQALYPGLKIAGRLCPTITVQGESLEYAPEIDSQIAKEINRSNPDIVFLNLGHPKQEIWFDRVKQIMKVPVAIGTGGSLDFISGAKKRAPEWVQKTGFEWLYRLIQEPKRLWKRYFFGGLKLCFMGLPLVAFHNLNRFLVKLQSLAEPKEAKEDKGGINNILFVSPNKTVSLFILPKVIDDAAAIKASKMIEDSFSQDVLCLDFKNTKHLTLEGLAFLIDLIDKSKKNFYPLYCVNICYRLRLFFRLHRIWDMLLPIYCKTASDFYGRICLKSEKKHLFLSLEQNPESAKLYFLGPIVNSDEIPPLLDRLIPILRGKKCLINLSFTTEIDNSGFSFLLKLKSQLIKEGSKLFWIIGSNTIKKSIKALDLEKVFKNFAN